MKVVTRIGALVIVATFAAGCAEQPGKKSDEEKAKDDKKADKKKAADDKKVEDKKTEPAKADG
jgi:PBP1b-binding outer membrane lipoprotein LpoB